jgi:pyridoxal phosphate enzyme, yggS family
MAENSIASRYQETCDRIAAACKKAGRSCDDVTLMVVTKFHPLSDVLELVRLGVRNFGENREQEARQKIHDLHHRDAEENILSGIPAEWSMIGQLQRNKCNSVARWASSVHSVDSARLVTGLSRGMQRALDEGERVEETLGVFLQVSLDGDTARGGAKEEEIFSLADYVDDADHLLLRGLMAVPPLHSDADWAFSQLYNLSQKLQVDHPHAAEISAGMSGDMEKAIAHGSTCVRIGTAILGPRPTHLTHPTQ